MQLNSIFYRAAVIFRVFCDGDILQKFHMRVCVHGTGTHLHCANNKPAKKFRNTLNFV